jgi:hypothetical protein
MTLQAKANTGTGTDNLATDFVAGEHIPLSKLVTGGLGTNGGPVTPTNPLPVDVRFQGGTEVSTAVPLPVTLANQGGPGNALYVQPLQGDVAANRAFTALVQGTTVLSPSNTLPTQLSTGGTLTSLTNPQPVGVALGGGAVSTANPLPMDILKGGAANSATNPLVIQVARGGAVTSATNPSDVQVSVAGAAVSDANPLASRIILPGGPLSTANSLPSQLTQAGASVTATNPLPSQLSQGNTAVSLTNPLATQLLQGGVAVTPINPYPVQLSQNNGVLSTANPIPTNLIISGSQLTEVNALPTKNHAEAIIVQTNLTGTLHQDLLTGVSGGWLDTLGNAEVSVTMVTTGTFTTGAISFEQSNDPSILVGVGTALPFDEPTSLGRNITNLTLSAATRTFRASPAARYVRCRVSTAVTGGGLISCRTFMRDIPSIPSAPATQPVSGTVAVSGVITANATPVSVVGAVLDASLARTTSGTGATGANGSGSGIIVYTNVTAVAGTTPTLALNLQVQDPVSAAWVNLPGTTFPTRTAIGLFATVVYPGAIAATDIINMGVPRVYRLAWTITGTTPSFTFSTAVASLL